MRSKIITVGKRILVFMLVLFAFTLVMQIFNVFVLARYGMKLDEQSEGAWAFVIALLVVIAYYVLKKPRADAV